MREGTREGTRKKRNNSTLATQERRRKEDMGWHTSDISNNEQGHAEFLLA